MTLWEAMQRIERYRYRAEVIAAHAAECSPELRVLMTALEREWLHLAAQTHALVEGRDPPDMAPIRFEEPSLDRRVA